MKIAVYPGSFDPFTIGHFDILRRSLFLFDKVIVAIGVNPLKKYLFTPKEKIDIVESYFPDRRIGSMKYLATSIETFDGLLVDYIKEKEADVIIRGLRSGSDFDMENDLIKLNRTLGSDIDTCFLASDTAYGHISSSMVKAIAQSGGKVTALTNSYVQELINKKYL